MPGNNQRNVLVSAIWPTPMEFMFRGGLKEQLGYSPLQRNDTALDLLPL